MTVPMENGKVVWIPNVTKQHKLEWIGAEYAKRVEDIGNMLAYIHELEGKLGIEEKYKLTRAIFTERFLLLRTDLFHKLSDVAQDRERKKYYAYREWQKTQLRNTRKAKRERELVAEVNTELEATSTKKKRVKKVKLTPRIKKSET